MDWITLIVTALGGTSLLGTIGSIIFFRETRRLKRNEVKSSNVETQKREIDLAEMYKDKVVELIEQLSNKQDNGNENQSRILGKLDKLDERMDKTESTLGDIVTYLNGDFQKYLKRMHAPAASRKRQTKPKTTDNDEQQAPDK